MSKFIGHKKTNDIDFGDYVQIEQHRYNSPNEMYIHKVVGALESNTYVDVPVRCGSEEKIHKGMEKVLRVICCGIDETKVFRVREKDCVKVDMNNNSLEKEIENLRETLEDLNESLFTERMKNEGLEIQISTLKEEKSFFLKAYKDKIMDEK